MTDPNPLAFAKLPADLLTLLASRAVHDSLQPLHHLVRLLHVLAAAGFFGSVALLDLRALRPPGVVPFAALARQVHPWLVTSFALTIASGVVLFAYDPIRVGAHAYFTPKLALLALGLGNARLLHRARSASRLAGVVSLAAWLGVMICSALNHEAAPRVALW